MSAAARRETPKNRAQLRHREQMAVKHRMLNASRFSSHEFDGLVLVYNELSNSEWSTGTPDMSIACLQTVMYLVLNVDEPTVQIHRIVDALLTGESLTCVTLPEWMRAMTLFLRGTPEEQMRFCFGVYDRTGTNSINADQALMLLHDSALIRHQSMDQDELELELQGLVDVMMRKLDVDRDWVISFEDYCAVVTAQPLMLECFGRCLPDRASLYAFVTTFSERPRKY